MGNLWKKSTGVYILARRCGYMANLKKGQLAHPRDRTRRGHCRGEPGLD